MVDCFFHRSPRLGDTLFVRWSRRLPSLYCIGKETHREVVEFFSDCLKFQSNGFAVFHPGPPSNRMVRTSMVHLQFIHDGGAISPRVNDCVKRRAATRVGQF